MSDKLSQMAQKQQTAQQLKTKSDLHLSRKIWHFLTVFFMVCFYHFAPLWLSYTTLILVGGLGILIDFARLNNESINNWVIKVLGPVMRKSEINSIAGTTSLIIGVLFIASLFERPIVELSLLFLAVADPGASYFGIRFGKDKLWNGKSLQGSLAAFVICTLLALAYFSYFDLMTERIFIASLIAGLIGSLSEAIPVANLDDNFTIPTLSAFGLWCIFSVFGGFVV